MAAHPIGDAVQLLIRKDEEGVLVVVSLHPNVTAAGDFNPHGRRATLPSQGRRAKHVLAGGAPVGQKLAAGSGVGLAS